MAVFQILLLQGIILDVNVTACFTGCSKLVLEKIFIDHTTSDLIHYITTNVAVKTLHDTHNHLVSVTQNPVLWLLLTSAAPVAGHKSDTRSP